mmetsp:Transcript_8219/g.24496  ORF Transcript_8219/g.24496 Transcript_8219/m.24496 type:complete len:409 (+) Transcript_8219:197-1423(+)
MNLQAKAPLKRAACVAMSRASVALSQPSGRAVAIVKASAQPQIADSNASRIVYATAAGSQHDKLGHPECAARIPAIQSALEAAGLTAEARPNQLISLLDFRPANLKQVRAIHSERYVERLRELVENNSPSLVDADTYITSTSYNDAFRAAGAAIALVDAVVEASFARAEAADGISSTTGFGICRPPGHHALPAVPMGFCLLSTIAIAARYCQQEHGLQRVAIFDFDVHHGNGTHDTFYSEPDILFVSTHQRGTFPFTGKHSETGKGDGEGASINIPLPGDAGDAAMHAAFEEVVGPALDRFRPSVILVSAGYDAHWKDPLAGLQMCTSTYHRLGQQLVEAAGRLCQGRLVFLLEGGYDLNALGASVADTFRGVLGDSSADGFDPGLLRDEPTSKVRDALREARRIHNL